MEKVMEFKNGFIYYFNDSFKLRYQIANISSYICSVNELRELNIGLDRRVNQEIKILKDKVVITNNSIVTTHHPFDNPLHSNARLKSIWQTSSNELEMTEKQIVTFSEILRVINNEFVCPDCHKKPNISHFRFNCTWCGLSGPTFARR